MNNVTLFLPPPPLRVLWHLASSYSGPCDGLILTDVVVSDLIAGSMAMEVPNVILPTIQGCTLPSCLDPLTPFPEAPQFNCNEFPAVLDICIFSSAASAQCDFCGKAECGVALGGGI